MSRGDRPPGVMISLQISINQDKFTPRINETSAVF